MKNGSKLNDEPFGRKKNKTNQYMLPETRQKEKKI